MTYCPQKRRERYLKSQQHNKKYAKKKYRVNREKMLCKYHLNKPTSLYFKFIKSEIDIQNHFFYKYLDILDARRAEEHYKITNWIATPESISLKIRNVLINITETSIAFANANRPIRSKPIIHDLSPESVNLLCDIHCKKAVLSFPSSKKNLFLYRKKNLAIAIKNFIQHRQNVPHDLASNTQKYILDTSALMQMINTYDFESSWIKFKEYCERGQFIIRPEVRSELNAKLAGSDDGGKYKKFVSEFDCFIENEASYIKDYQDVLKNIGLDCEHQDLFNRKNWKITWLVLLARDVHNPILIIEDSKKLQTKKILAIAKNLNIKTLKTIDFLKSQNWF